MSLILIFERDAAANSQFLQPQQNPNNSVLQSTFPKTKEKVKVQAQGANCFQFVSS